MATHVALKTPLAQAKASATDEDRDEIMLKSCLLDRQMGEGQLTRAQCADADTGGYGTAYGHFEGSEKSRISPRGVCLGMMLRTTCTWGNRGKIGNDFAWQGFAPVDGQRGGQKLR